MTPDAGLVEFIRELRWDDVPAPARRRIGFLLADHAAVVVAGRATPAARLAAEHAAAVHPAAEATALWDGRVVGAVGAAFGNGVLANALDFDDGHRITKGHPGAAVVPAALAAAQLADAPVERLLGAVAVGYEVAVRAGAALHRREATYHASGAWGALGAAAAAASLLELAPRAVEDALGLAEYHAPIAPIMRSVAEPAMTKDACGHGAALGLGSALLAARGFTSLPAALAREAGDGLGVVWRVEEVYVKAFPCCRWSQPAIAAALSIRDRLPGEADAIERVIVGTFTAAGGLAGDPPGTTEEAQYSLVWPVAVALARGRFGVQDVLGPFGDARVDALSQRVAVEVDPRLESDFPERRRSSLTVHLRDGRVVESAAVEAPGECRDPAWEDIVAGKVGDLLTPGHAAVRPAPDGLRGVDAAGLVDVLCSGLPAVARA